MLCASTDGPDSSSPLENKLGGFGQHFQSVSIGRDPISPPCPQGLNFRVTESPHTVTIPHVRWVECLLPFLVTSCLLWCEGFPKTCAFCAGMQCWDLSRCWRHPVFLWVLFLLPYSKMRSQMISLECWIHQQRLGCLNTAQSFHFPLSPRDGNRAGGSWGTTSSLSLLNFSCGSTALLLRLTKLVEVMFLAQDGWWGVVFSGSIFEDHLLPVKSEDTSLHGMTRVCCTWVEEGPWFCCAVGEELSERSSLGMPGQGKAWSQLLARHLAVHDSRPQHRLPKNHWGVWNLFAGEGAHTWG